MELAPLISAGTRETRRSLVRNELESGDHVPVAALGIVPKLSNRVPCRQALDAPPLGHNVLVASHDEYFGVRHCCRRCIHAADILREIPHKSVADLEHPDKRKEVMARINQRNYATKGPSPPMRRGQARSCPQRTQNQTSVNFVDPSRLSVPPIACWLKLEPGCFSGDGWSRSSTTCLDYGRSRWRTSGTRNGSRIATLAPRAPRSLSEP